MKLVEITTADYLELKQIQVKLRKGWHAVFSTNCLDHKWSFVTRGWTPLYQRNELHKFPVIDVLAEEYGRVRNERGRVFIDSRGAFYKDWFGIEIQFATFKFVESRVEGQALHPE